MVEARKRPRGESKSPHEQPRKHSKAGSGLVATLHRSEGECQNWAFAAERDVKHLQLQYKKLEKEFGELRTSSESDRVRLVAAETTERARADSWKTRAAKRKEHTETLKAERDTDAKLLEDAEATILSLEDLVAKAETDAQGAHDDLKQLRTKHDTDAEELQRLRRDSTIVVPSGRLRLYHRIYYDLGLVYMFILQ
jgi:chromosome segregation ATPase